jgi:hypothetical protein
MKLSQIIYTSEINLAAFPTDGSLKGELEKMLESARRRNQNASLTGILVFSGGHFIQVLEGHPKVLERLYARIAVDDRHKNVERLAVIDIQERMFSKWQMGLLNLEEHRHLDRELFNRFLARLDSPITHSELSQLLYELLHGFKAQLEDSECEASIQ